MDATTGSSKGGRPAGFDREAAVEAAMHLFCQRGYLAVSASDLAQAMALQRSSFYNSFGSKEGVFREALQRYAEHAPDAEFERIGSDGPIVPAIVDVFRRVCRLRARADDAEGCLVTRCVHEVVGVDDTMGALVEAAVKARMATLERLLRTAARRGELEVAEPRRAAQALMATLLGMAALAKVVRDEKQLWAVCARLLAGQGLVG
jgi:TetR/AcrR family transcriptional repressor of nem operon